MRWAGIAVTSALLLAACDHYAAAEVPEPRPLPSLTPGPGSSQISEPPTGPACPNVTIPAPTAVVQTLRAEDGSCVPPAEAVVYRCDPTYPPVATFEIGDKRVRRFLGGAYAVDVPTIPEGAVSMGVAAEGRLWTIPGDDHLLFVEAAGTVQRWLELRGRNELPDLPSATVIGDSLMDGAAEALVARLPGWAVTIDAEVGRGSYGAASIAEALPEPHPDVLVVEIGVNDHDPVGFATNVDRVVAAADHPLLLVWLTAHGPASETDDINRALRARIGPHPGSTIIDWDAIVPEDALNSDGVHLLPGQESLLAEPVATTLQTWREATAGDGPTGCAGAVAAAAKRAS
jgi:hypothetical protein